MKVDTGTLSRIARLHNAMMQTNTDGTILDVNQKFCEMSGYSPEELIGKNPRLLNSGFHPPEFFASIYQTLLHGETWKGEIRNQTKTGEHYWVRSTIQPQFDTTGKILSFIALQTETTRQVKAESAAKHLKQRLDLIFEIAPVGIVELDQNLNPVQMNPQAFELLQGNEIPWMKIQNCMEVQSRLRQCLNQAQEQSIKIQLKPEQEQEWTICSLGGAESTSAGLLILVRDLSEINRMTRQVLAISEEEEMRIGRELHDTLGQTLAGLCLKFSLLKPETLETNAPSFEKQLRNALNQTRRLAREHCAHHINDGLSNAIALILSEIREFGEIVADGQELDLLDELPPSQWLPIYRILREALFNALRHSEGDRFQILVRKSSERILIQIIDNGVGIEETKPREGLGLKIARYRAELIGGELSYPPRVCGFCFQLNLQNPQG